MKPVEPSIDMTLRKARNVELITPDIALKLAEMVFKKTYGETVVAGQLPLIVKDRDVAWQVEGTFRKYASTDLSDQSGGQLVIVIKKLDAQILEFTRLMILPQSGIPLPANPLSPPPN